MRILTVANHLGSRGGLERTQLSMCRVLADRGHRIDLVYVSRGDFAGAWEEFTDAMIEVGSTLPLRRRPVVSTSAVLNGLRQSRRLQPDVILVYRYWDIPFAVILKRLTGAPLALYLCLPPPDRVQWWLRAALRQVDRAIAVSQDTARRWAPSGLPVEVTSVVLTGIDMDIFVPATAAERQAARADLGLAPDTFVVLYAGRIEKDKGIDVLVQACRHLEGQLPDLHLLVLGGPFLGADPNESRRYEQELHRLADGLAVSWLGVREDIVHVVHAADVGVVPSLWPEPLARSLIEPLACGIPVVATKVGGNPEVLAGWLAQYLVGPADPDGLAEKLRSLANWRDRDPTVGARCREAVVERLSLGREADDVAAALGALCGR